MITQEEQPVEEEVNIAPPCLANSCLKPKAKKPIHYMKVTCPMQTCKQELVLSCPFCLGGALECKNRMLVCSQCKNSVAGVNCSCGFTVRASYISDKQARLTELKNNVDVDNYKMIGVLMFGMIAAMIVCSLLS